VNIPNDEHVGDREKAVSTPGVRALVRGVLYEISGEIDRADRSVGIMAESTPNKTRGSMVGCG